MTVHYYIAYISPHGSTAKVAEAMAGQLSRAGAAASLTDLSDTEAARSLVNLIKTDEKACLFIGSPVYRDMAVPPVMAFIDQLPETGGLWAVPFVTYGAVSSGVALWQMAGTLQKKGFQIAAAAKVAAVHSAMWQSELPLGAGHPNADDLGQIQDLIDMLVSQFSEGEPEPLALEVLDYQPREFGREFKAEIDQPRIIMPKTIDTEACTQCGVCVDVCPAGAIYLDPMPELDGKCFDCYNCIRLCPEDAIELGKTMAEIEAMIHDLATKFNEQPPTEIFFRQSAG